MLFRTIHGHRRAFVLTGQGPAVLLIHGIGDSSVTWRSIIPRLARDHTVIAPDLLGHGASDKPRADYSIAGYANAMRDLLSVLGIDRATVVGHSLGGGVAMQFAYQYPERCERVVLVSTGGVGKDVNPLLRIASAPNADLVLPLLSVRATRAAVSAGFSVLQALQTDIGRDADNFLRVFDALPDVASRTAFVRTLRAVVDMRGQVITMLDRCYLMRDRPTLLVWGKRDPIIPYEHGVMAHAAMPWSRLETFEGAGHFPHITHAARFLDVLDDFFATTAPAAHDSAAWRELLRIGRPDTVQGNARAAEDQSLQS